jgi:hypothetical protein
MAEEGGAAVRILQEAMEAPHNVGQGTLMATDPMEMAAT